MRFYVVFPTALVLSVLTGCSYLFTLPESATNPVDTAPAEDAGADVEAEDASSASPGDQ